MSLPGVNYLIRNHGGLLAQGRLAVCNSTDRIFDRGNVLILDQFEDCTGFRCPACGGRHDTRPAPSGGVGRRMGYTELTPPLQPGPSGRRWVTL